jgi:hypothetical protein
MLRSTFDRLLSYVGLLIAVILLVVSGLAFWGFSFANGQVSDQLSAQKITMPTQAAMGNIPDSDKAALAPFAGQPMASGDAALAYANHYIAVHMDEAGQNTAGVNKAVTYSESGALCSAAQKTDPTQAQKATQDVCNLKQTLFQGNTLRSMLLTAYAFGTIAKIALVGAIVTLVGGILIAILALLGFGHSKKAGDAVVGATAPMSAER